MSWEFREAAHGSADYDRTVRLRDEILRAPLGLSFSPEQLAAEVADIHLYLTEPGSQEVLACLVLTRESEPGVVRMRQVAVRADQQGKGLGRELVKFSETVARARDFKTMTLHARETVVPFYEKLGYAVSGEGFVEVSLPHLPMAKEL